MGKWNKIPRIHDLIKQRRIQTFVETGTGRGNGVRAALDHGFKRIYSAEKFKKAANLAKQLFSPHKNVLIVEGCSEDFLNNLLPLLDENPIFFWLDAHFPGEFHGVKRSACENERIRSPIKYELEIIFKERKKYGFQDIIAIDDLRMFNKSFRLFKQKLVTTELWEIKAMIPKGMTCTQYKQDHGYILIHSTPKKIML